MKRVMQKFDANSDITIKSSERLLKVLKDNRLTSKDLAEKISVSPYLISRILNRKARLTEDKAKLISDLFDGKYSVMWLLGRDKFQNETEKRKAVDKEFEMLQLKHCIASIMQLYGFNYTPKRTDPIKYNGLIFYPIEAEAMVSRIEQHLHQTVRETLESAQVMKELFEYTSERERLRERSGHEKQR